MKTKLILFTALLSLASCVNSEQQKLDQQEDELRNKMDKLKEDLGNMQKELDSEMQDLKKLQDSIEAFPVK